MNQFGDPHVEPTPAQPSAAAPTVFGFSFHGTGMAFFALMLKNMLLTLLTLGIYTPWAKTERRRYLWQNVELHGHRLRYHGTGKELAIGYAKVIAGYVVFLGIPILTQKLVSPVAGGLLQLLFALVLIPLIPLVIWGSRRFLLSRTSWRGVRFRLEGDATAYAKTFILGYLLTLLSLGLYGPIWLNRLHRLMMNATGIGTQQFEYRGEDKVVFRISIKGFFLSIVTFGIYYFWYMAELNRYRASQTWFDRAHGQLQLSGGDLFKLTLLQVFGLTLTLGLAFPWIATYSLRYTLSRLQFVGEIDLARVHAAPSQGNAAADGFADALDLGVAV